MELKEFSVEIMEWSREIVNHLMTKRTNLKDTFSVEIRLEPNPLDFDGVDSVAVTVLKYDDSKKIEVIDYYVDGISLNETIPEINKKIFL